MPDFLVQASAFTIFLALSALGLVFLVVSAITGEIFDLAGHGDSFDAHDSGPSFFSSRVLSVLVTAFGAAGAIAVHSGLSTAAASGVGFAAGVGCAALVYQFARFLFGQQATTETSPASLLGRSARVIVPIPADGVGQIRIQSGEELFDKVARSRSGAAVPLNAIVTIDEVLGEVVIVEPQTREAKQ